MNTTICYPPNPPDAEQKLELMMKLTTPNCPCCSDQLLQHIRHQKTVWFCRRCWQEMPNLNLIASHFTQE